MRSPRPDSAPPSADGAPVERLFVTWQDQDTREIRPVGLLCRTSDSSGERFQFRYLHTALREPFRPFVSFPELQRVYDSDELFPLFSNRVMRPQRPDYVEYLDRLSLPQDAAPFEVLAASGGIRATDEIEVFREPTIDESTGRAACSFLARGVRHVEGAAEAITSLRAGDRLRLVRDTANPVDPRAIGIETIDGRAVGFVPAYLVDFLHRVGREGDRIEDSKVRVENPNSVGPYHLRLLCQLDTRMPVGGFLVGDLLPIVPFGSDSAT